MGNTQSGSILTRTGGALDSFVAELGPDVIYEKSLGSARFLKTVKCRHQNGSIVVKIFIKSDPGVTLRAQHKRLKIEREALHDIANVYSYQAFVETERAGYALRQWVASSLYDRISTRPFLAHIEKKWIAFQILTGFRDARKRKVSHGDIKSENILVTSWNWVYITDFASYKPTFLPLDDPSDFAYYFDTSGRRSCYIAPERFYTAEKNPDISAKKAKIRESGAAGFSESSKRDGKITEAMDVFSTGCVLAELFLEGTPLFTLSQLFKYREGDLDIDGLLSAIDDGAIKSCIKDMIAVDPSKRPSFDTILHTSRGTIFPESFYSFLYDFFTSICRLPSQWPFSSIPTEQRPFSVTPSAKPSAISETAVNNVQLDAIPLPTESDRRLDRLWSEYESLEPHIMTYKDKSMTEVLLDYTPNYDMSRPLQNIIPVVLHFSSQDIKTNRHVDFKRRAPTQDGPALMILSFICANIRNSILPHSKLRALDVMLALSQYLTDEAKLDRMVPYLVDLLHDDSALVRASSLRTLTQILMLVMAITPFNAAVFSEFILPNLRSFSHDPDVTVRCMLAQCIVPLAETAVKYLEMGQALRAHGTFKFSSFASQYEETQYEVSYESGLEELQKHVQEQVSALLVDPSSIVKRAVLHDISSLCIFFGRQKTNDVLLSHMITYLNDRDWLLRYAFFDSIVGVSACLGGHSLEEYILPLMMQALSDVEEAVVSKVLASLTSICELGLFQKMKIWELMSATLAFLYHPNVWIRQGAVAFIGSAIKHLPPTDVWCILYPSLRHFLRSEVRLIDPSNILLTLKSPLARHIYDASLEWAIKSDKSQFWKSHRRAMVRLESPRDGVASMRKGSRRANVSKSEEDDAQLHKLQLLGMAPAEEMKLMALRDYMIKLALATDSFRSRSKSNYEADVLKTVNDVELQSMDVVPQTVFLGSLSKVEDLSKLSSENAKKDYTADELQRFDNNYTFTSNAPYEDLRRRLATINGTAFPIPPTSGTRERQTSLLIGQRLPSISAEIPTTLDIRPGSPTESVGSTTNSVSVRHRIHISSTDSQKAAPAVGSVKTNAVGSFEVNVQSHAGSSTDDSSWASPTAHMTRDITSGLNCTNGYGIDDQDSGLKHLLEHIRPEGSGTTNDFGPRVHEGPIRRRNTTRRVSSVRDGRSLSLETTLISHLSSHSAPVNGIAVAADHTFFVSCSDDKTVKVWDTARLERNVTSKPRHTYGQHHARVTCVCMLECLHCFASAADDGTVHVIRVPVGQSTGGSLPKYGKLQVIREHRAGNAGEYVVCMKHYNFDMMSILLYATSHSVVVQLDLKTMRVIQRLEMPQHLGPLVTFCVDKKRSWLVAATSSGILTLWDLRFGLLLRSWAVGNTIPDQQVQIRQCTLHPSKGRGRWVIVSMDIQSSAYEQESTVLMEVWDVEKVELVEYFSKRKSGNVSPSAANIAAVPIRSIETNAASSIASFISSRAQKSRSQDDQHLTFDQHLTTGEAAMPSSSPTISAIAVGVNFGSQGGMISDITEYLLDDMHHTQSSTNAGFMITGSEDRLLRIWDLEKIERSAVLSGTEDEKERCSFSTSSIVSAPIVHHTETWTNSTPGGGHMNRPKPVSITHHQQSLLKAHQDSITAVVCLDFPFRGSLITGDRSGVIKVWRVEGPERSSSAIH